MSMAKELYDNGMLRAGVTGTSEASHTCNAWITNEKHGPNTRKRQKPGLYHLSPHICPRPSYSVLFQRTAAAAPNACEWRTVELLLC